MEPIPPLGTICSHTDTPGESSASILPATTRHQILAISSGGHVIEPVGAAVVAGPEPLLPELVPATVVLYCPPPEITVRRLVSTCPNDRPIDDRCSIQCGPVTVLPHAVLPQRLTLRVDTDDPAVGVGVVDAHISVPEIASPLEPVPLVAEGFFKDSDAVGVIFFQQSRVVLGRL